MSNARNFGVQSFCFRNFKDNAAVAEKVREIGLDKIEVCAVHADFNDPDGWEKEVETYRKAGVQIVSIGVQTFTGAESEEKWFACAAAAGAKHISCHFQVNSFMTAIPKVRRWSAKYGIQVGIHTHGGYLFGGSPDVARYLLDLGGPEIGLCLDTAWLLQIGPRQGNPLQWAKNFAGQIYGIHYKDFVFEPNGQWRDVVVGTGNLDLPAFVGALEEGGFQGMTVIEYEADPDNPVPALTECVQRMRSLT